MISDHDAHIAEAPQELRPLLVRLRAQLARALPDASAKAGEIKTTAAAAEHMAPLFAQFNRADSSR
jgi:hypothetical protein